MAERIYRVWAANAEWLVRATSRAAARTIVARAELGVELAAQDDLIRMTREGVVVLTAADVGDDAANESDAAPAEAA
jgi:hypothetical protein